MLETREMLCNVGYGHAVVLQDSRAIVLHCFNQMSAAKRVAAASGASSADIRQPSFAILNCERARIGEIPTLSKSFRRRAPPRFGAVAQSAHMAWAGRPQSMSHHSRWRQAVHAMPSHQVRSTSHQFVVQNCAAVDQMRAKGRLNAEKGKTMPRAHSPMGVEARSHVRIHDAALDKPPEKVDLAVRQRQRERRVRSEMGRGGHETLSGKTNGKQNLDRGIEMTRQLPTRNRRHHQPGEAGGLRRYAISRNFILVTPLRIGNGSPMQA